MFASKIIGLAALLLVPIFFYIQMAIPKLRSAFILSLAFASAGLAGYSSASSIGIGWTVSLAFLTFLGITVSVIYMSKREDQQIEQQFELALKSDHAVFVMPTDKVAFASHSMPGGEECLPAITNTSIEVLAIKQHEAPIPAEKASTLYLGVGNSEPPLGQPQIQMPEIPEVEYASREESTEELFFKASKVIVPIVEEVEPKPLIVAFVPQLQDESIPELAEVLPAEALSVEAQTLKSEPVILPKDRERIQTLSAYAEQALVEGDFLRAYQSLREALTYSPPIMATYILSRQLVQVLNEMGLYEESISVMEKVLNESTSLSPKKREEFIRQISYLEELTKQLQIENKRNLSWSLVPPYIHQKVNTHFHTSVVSNHDHSTAIPFQ